MFTCVIQVVKVDPKDISGKYSSILASPAIAIDVTCKLSLHKELYVNLKLAILILIFFLILTFICFNFILYFKHMQAFL